MGQSSNGNGQRATDTDQDGILFFLEDGEPANLPASPSRLVAARAALREAQQAEWEERQRVVRAGTDGVTPAHAALLAARQAHAQAAEAAVIELRRRAVSLRHALAMAEQALAAQRRMADRLRRELAEIGE